MQGDMPVAVDSAGSDRKSVVSPPNSPILDHIRNRVDTGSRAGAASVPTTPSLLHFPRSDAADTMHIQRNNSRMNGANSRHSDDEETKTAVKVGMLCHERI
jgi:hypothetical protein